MNHAHRSVFNTALDAWVAVPETAKAHGKGGRRQAATLAAAILALTVPYAQALEANVLPTGGMVTAGSGSVASAGATLTVNQTSQKLAIDWQSFNIGANATVNFVQPGRSAIALNRVVGSDKSEIYGHLNANGQVFLLNSNGILFGKTAEVNVGGLVASTLNLSNADFMSGNYRFTGAAGSLINEGNITAADHGYVALLGGQVSNQGTLVAKLGNVSLAAGRDITLDFAGDGLINLQVNQGAVNALAENKQLIRADGGTVLMTAKAADSLIQAVVNNEGVIEARGIDTSGGTIKLLADMDNGVVNVGGTLDASAQGGNSGFIETSGHSVSLQSGAMVKAKNWLIDPTDIIIDAAAASAIVTSLNGGTNVTETTSSGGTDAGNIAVVSAVAWTGTGTLTLNADNNIAINAAITGTNGGLTLSAVNSISAPAAVNVGTFDLQSGVWSQISSNLPSFSANDFRISGGSFIRALGGDGASSTPYQLADIYGVQGMGSSGMVSKSYTLANDIDASGTANWNSGAGFNPVGNDTDYPSNVFTGTFDGLDHAISNLTINRPTTDNVGLFGYANGGQFANVRLLGGQVTGKSYTGSLVGELYNGSVSNVQASTNVTGLGGFTGGLVGDALGTTLSNVTATGNVSGQSSTGGLIGNFARFGANLASLTNASATGDVSGTARVGGLIGETTYSTISNASATGRVTGSGNFVGGLIGSIEVGSINVASSLSNVHATGAVSGGGSDVGGLIGHVLCTRASCTPISQAYATGSVSGSTNVGGLIGFNQGDISDSYATGNVVAGSGYAGGLVGKNGVPAGASYGSSIVSSHALGNVSSSGGDYLGGLVGANYAGAISDSYATGNVSGAGNYHGGLAGISDRDSTISGVHATGSVSSSGNYIGGLIGELTTGSLENAYATGNVSGNDYVGGLIGRQGNDIYSANVTIAHATGDVVGNQYVGGLVGSAYLASTVSRAYATGNVSSSFSVAMIGGLVGHIKGRVSLDQVYATGDVTASGGSIGGLVGKVLGEYGTVVITDAYASGNVTATGNGDQLVGGLVGYIQTEYCTIERVYATGRVSGLNLGHDSSTGITTRSGGLFGKLSLGTTVSNATFDTTTTGMATATSAAADSLDYSAINAAHPGHTTAEMKSLATFSSWGTSIDSVGGSGATWRIYDGYTAPLLRSFLTPLTVTAGGSKIYDGSTDASSALTYSATYDGALLLGTATTSRKNVGTYSVTPSDLYSSQQGYDISYVSGSVTITPKDASVTGSATNLTYNGATQTQNAAATSGFLNGDDISITGLASGRNANTYTSNLVVAGEDAGNYNITVTNADLSIGKANATVTANSGNVTYNGLTQSVSGFTASGLVNGETAAVLTGVTAGGAGKNAGTYTTTASGSDGNYVLTFVEGALNIGKAHLTVTANDQSRLYGQSNPAFTETITGFVNGENATSAGITGSATGSSAASATTGVGRYAITGSTGNLAAANYDFTAVDGILTIGESVGMNPSYQASVVEAHGSGRGLPANLASSDTGSRQGRDELFLTVVDGGMLLPAGLK